jgi:putative FmdB family regulatory protein
MPIYKFKCDSCGYEFTVIRKISDDGEVECENCESNLTNKMLARSSFTLKGSGWYKDGYTNKSEEKN